ncbi:MAG: DUF2520 domain-containing protein [Candidatus Koribacter versatilis]|uniref:DUF2520 domain-containing protein n=1 Tax=Candidatus Korobacter versatilis TaxID=658062 RepID=A0A932A6V1_9BACT|nr:DUF2520 domain-containing protein [Candidatus Koribacter versatilis]
MSRGARPSVTIIGAGNLARALAPALRAARYRVREVVGREGKTSRARTRAVARSAGARAVGFADAKLDADVIWLCVSDSAIAQVARRLAKSDDWRGKVALHSSGALGSDELRALKARGASVASVHPMMTFVGTARVKLRGLTFAVEGDARAVGAARGIVAGLGGEAFAIRKQNKPLYHALGSFSSPLLVMLLSEAEQVGRAAGLSAAQTRKVMRAILQRTLFNYLRDGAAAAFSGPMRRGDLVTVKRHLKDLRKVPGALEVYRALARGAMGRLPVGRRREMERMF